MSWKVDFTTLLCSLDGTIADMQKAYQLKYANLPSSIYKYRSIDERSLQNLRDGTIWLADPATLNDPYECSFMIDPGRSRVDLTKYLTIGDIDQLVRGGFPEELLSACDGTTSTRAAMIDALYADYPVEEREKMKPLLLRFIDERNEDFAREASVALRSSFKLCSFSERVDSTLMWSHYADSHKGYCIEYDIRSLPESDLRTRLLYPVIYSEDVFDATELFETDPAGRNIAYTLLAGLTKASDWKYECEWRLMFPNGLLDSPRPWPMPTPTGVYLGARISSEGATAVRDVCSSLGVPVWNMRHSPHRFEIEVDR